MSIVEVVCSQKLGVGFLSCYPQVPGKLCLSASAMHVVLACCSVKEDPEDRFGTLQIERRYSTTLACMVRGRDQQPGLNVAMLRVHPVRQALCGG